MSNPLTTGQQPQMNPQQAMEQLKANPVGMLKQAGYNVPDELASNPGGIIQHLVQSGQLPQNRLTQIMRMFGRR